MPNEIYAWIEKYNALTSRERYLILMTVFLCLFFGWYGLIFQPTQKKLIEIKNELQTVTLKIATQRQMSIELESRQKNDPNVEKQKQLVQLKTEYQKWQNNLSLANKNLIKPTAMIPFLNDLLQQDNRLSLITFDKLPTIISIDLGEQQIIYKHGLTLQFNGNYQATLEYLQKLEASNWHFFWDSIHYQVTEYPLAKVSLNLHTLSLEKSWLHV